MKREKSLCRPSNYSPTSRIIISWTQRECELSRDTPNEKLLMLRRNFDDFPKSPDTPIVRDVCFHKRVNPSFISPNKLRHAEDWNFI